MLEPLLDREQRDSGGPAPGESWAGRIAAPPTDQGVEVVLPGYSLAQRWGPCPYAPRVELDESDPEDPKLTLREPARGDRCLVAFDESLNPWVVVWWP